MKGRCNATVFQEAKGKRNTKMAKCVGLTYRLSWFFEEFQLRLGWKTQLAAVQDNLNTEPHSLWGARRCLGRRCYERPFTAPTPFGGNLDTGCSWKGPHANCSLLKHLISKRMRENARGCKRRNYRWAATRGKPPLSEHSFSVIMNIPIVQHTRQNQHIDVSSGIVKEQGLYSSKPWGGRRESCRISETLAHRTFKIPASYFTAACIHCVCLSRCIAGAGRMESGMAMWVQSVGFSPEKVFTARSDFGVLCSSHEAAASLEHFAELTPDSQHR